ncbi:ribonuclease H family protein [Oceanobacillus iheyensis]|uniref:ribonuclease H family protein n=1 Tax=Oceanobacillus iheyensis TaxID=182710 RepID=UPI001E3E0523|nr:ribonuclease H family protein [Oceanobacillus iheyensis]
MTKNEKKMIGGDKVNIRLAYMYRAKGIEINFMSDEMRIEDGVIVAEKLEKEKSVQNLYAIDDLDRTWSTKELKRLVAQVEEEPHHILVYFDGGFDRNDLIAGVGVVIYYEKNKKYFRRRKNVKLEQLDNNNEAEYAGLYHSLELLEEMQATHQSITFKGDSMVVIHQLKEEWPCYEENLQRWIDRIENKIEQLGIQPDYQVIPRKDNKEADQLASQSIQGIQIESTLEINKRK